MTASTRPGRLSWTPLGVRMGFTSEAPQREQIIAAIGRMCWLQMPTHPHYLDSPAVRHVVLVVLHQRHDQLHRVGVAQLNGGRQLIGLEDTLGTRSYVLDLDDEAIYVLAELPPAPSAHPSPAALPARTTPTTKERTR